jgi:carbamoyltransferase
VSIVLGVSGLYHDSAVALVVDGVIVAAAEEERFSRTKHDARLPEQAIGWLSAAHGLTESGVSDVVFYERPLSKLDRIARMQRGRLDGWSVTQGAVRGFLKEKLFVEAKLRHVLSSTGVKWHGELLYADHHLSHAASAFYPSSFDEAAVLCLDGVGEWSTGSIWSGKGSELALLEETHFPHSVGLFYAAMCQMAGFKVNSGEYKLMGLAPYGKPRFYDTLVRNVICVQPDGSVILDMKYFSYVHGDRMTSPALYELLGCTDETMSNAQGEPTEIACDIAASAQKICDEAVLLSAKHARLVTGYPRLALAGGVALNCVSVGYLLEQGAVDEVFVQPASSDAGGALGCAMQLAAQKGELARPWVAENKDGMRGGFLSYEISAAEVKQVVEKYSLVSTTYDTEGMDKQIADAVCAGNVVAVCRGRGEFGPRALGNRSILADARDSGCQSKLNLSVKQRESFRPFAPAVLEEDVKEWFCFPYGDEHMNTVAKLREDKRVLVEYADGESVMERVQHARASIPAVVHLDYSARVQIVGENSPLGSVLEHVKRATGAGIVVNTSFNRRGEPIVRTAEEAYVCFARTGIEYLVLGDVLIARSENTHSGAQVPDEALEMD